MNIRSRLSSLREYLTPINNESNFLVSGEISPEEFVVAGDYLVQKFPTWSWGTCAKGLQKAFLPPDKQFLVTRHVPSYRRYSSFVPDLDGAMDYQTGKCDSDDASIEVIPSFQRAEQETEVDLDAELVEEDLDDEIDDYATIPSDQSGLRRYDLYVAYSTSYRVPKMYLVGYNGGGIPLLPQQMYEDISGDHKDKTATIEPLPMAQNTTGVSIHPCKHASVMKVFMEHARKRSDEQEAVRVDHYLVIFLKFIASVTPGIEYDFTMDAL